MAAITAPSKDKVMAEFNDICGRLTTEERSILGTMLLMGASQAEDSEVEGHMMGNPYTAYDLAKLHQNDMQREAADYRLAEQATKKSTWGRFTWGLGGWLVATGRRLRGSPIHIGSAGR